MAPEACVDGWNRGEAGGLEGIYLNCLARALCDGPAVGAGVDPCEGKRIGALPKERVGGIDLYAIASSLDVIRDDLKKRPRQPVREVLVLCPFYMTAGRVQKPQGRVGGVVLGRAGIGAVRQHSLRKASRHAQQQRAAFLRSTALEAESLVRGHRVPRPIAKPRISRDHRRAETEELVGPKRRKAPCFIAGAARPDYRPRAFARAPHNGRSGR